MSGLKNTFHRVMNTVRGRGYKTGGERVELRALRSKEAMDKIFGEPQLPDEEALRLTAKRKQAKRLGSRVETVLTDQLGGQRQGLA